MGLSAALWLDLYRFQNAKTLFQRFGLALRRNHSLQPPRMMSRPATPPHRFDTVLALPGFLPVSLAAELALEFPRTCPLHEPDVRGWGRAFRRLDALLPSPPLMKRMRDIVGASELHLDSRYRDAGLRATDDGSCPTALPATLEGWRRAAMLLVEVAPVEA